MVKKNMLERSVGEMVRGGADGDRTEEFLPYINSIALDTLNANDIYVRSMYLCSTRVCPQDYGAFSRVALEQISTMIIGQSVMVGHNRSGLPIARFCHAEIVQREGEEYNRSPIEGVETEQPVVWLRAWFYWMREASGAEDLRLNIDGGIYRETSVSWRFRKSICSICGEEIHRCEHMPCQKYNGKVCYYIIDEVAEVLEGSIVFKGAESETNLARGNQQSAVIDKQVSGHSRDVGNGAPVEMLIPVLDLLEGQLQVNRLERVLDNIEKAKGKRGVDFVVGVDMVD